MCMRLCLCSTHIYNGHLGVMYDFRYVDIDLVHLQRISSLVQYMYLFRLYLVCGSWYT